MHRLLFLLALGACAGDVDESIDEPMDRRPLLVLYTTEDLELGQQLRAELEAEEALDELVRFQVWPPDAQEFQAAFGTGGRLGLVWYDAAGRVEEGMRVSVLPGYAPVHDVLARSREVERGLAFLERFPAGPEFLAELQLKLRAEAPAQARLEAALAAGPDAALEALLARALVRRGQIQAALAVCDDLEQREPAWAARDSVLLTRALARIASREPERALELLERVAPSCGETDQVLLARGIARHHAEEEDAMAPLGLVLQRYPLSPWSPDVRDEIEHILSPPSEHTH